MKQYYNDSYFIINIIFAGVIGIIFLYSGIFSADKDNHLIKSACIEIAGKPCKSVGLSNSFSEIVRLDFDSARQYNKYGLKVFSFFFIQFFTRILVAFFILKNILRRNTLLYIDILFTISLFLVTFADFLDFWNFE